MMKLLGVLLLGLAAGISVAAIKPWQSLSTDQLNAGELVISEERLLAMEERIRFLEQGLNDAPPTVRNNVIEESDAERIAGLGDVVVENPEIDDVAESDLDRFLRRRNENHERREQRLRDVGFSEPQIDRIKALTTNNQLRSIERSWERRRQRYLESTERPPSLRDNFIQEFGVDAYEKYLEARGSRTKLKISEVFPGTVADVSGLRTGDRIVAIDGERVFNNGDLNRSLVKGERGEPIAVEVERDGGRFSLTVERGPLGVQTRGR